MSQNKLLKAALWYAEKKFWPVIALHTTDNYGVCTCYKAEACPHPGKHPQYDADTLAHGAASATVNPDTIKTWWTRWPSANVGIATGPQSFDVLDVDQPDGPDTLRDLENQNGELPDTIEQITGGGGRQILFQYAGGQIGNAVKFAKCLDTRGMGGLIVVPPSKHLSGRHYEWEASSRPDSTELAQMPKWLIDLAKGSSNGHGTVDVELVFEGIPEGGRDEALFKYACRLRAKNLTRIESEQLLCMAADKCRPPFARSEATKKVAQAWKYNAGDMPEPDVPYFPDTPDTPDLAEKNLTILTEPDSNLTANLTKPDSPAQKNLRGCISLFVEGASGKFNTLQLDRELNLTTRRERQYRSEYLSELIARGIIEKSKTVTGEYRRRNKDRPEMDVFSATIDEVRLDLPLKLMELLYINRKDIILISGETNAGKTAFMFATMWLNIRFLQDNEQIREKSVPPAEGGIGFRFLSSEGHAARVKRRLMAFGEKYPIQEFIRYVASYYMQDGFHDMVDPDGFNFIDYIEAKDGEFHKLGEPLTQIHHTLDSGIAFVGVQQKKGSNGPRGGDLCLEKPTLALSLMYNNQGHYHTAVLLKVKEPRPRENGGLGPCQGMEMDFVIHNGVQFVPVSGWDWPQNHQIRRKGANYSEW